MPLHDWTRADRSLFHSFCLGWVSGISASLNCGVLPSSHYALTETIRDGRKPSFVELPEEADGPVPKCPGELPHYLDCPPRTAFRDGCTHPEYAEKVITIRQSALHNVIAAIRIMAADTKR